MKKVNMFTTPAFNLANIDFYQFVTAQATRIKALGDTVLTDADLKQLVVVLLSFAEDFNKAILQVQKSLKSEDIIAKDKTRDTSVFALKAGVNNAKYATSPEEVQAAAGISILLDTYGDIAHMPLDKESGAIDKLIAELEGPTYGPMIAKMGISSRVTRLKADNNAFKGLYDSRRNDSIGKDDVRPIELRKQVNEQYQLLCDYVQLKASMSGDAQYAQSLEIINTIRKEYNEKVARHKAALKAAEEKKKAEEKQKEEQQKKTKKS
jgi:hypothetical protein